jgi:hypothetical protein
MNQVWDQIHRTQIPPSITTEHYDVSDEDTSSIHHDIEIEDDEDENDEGECSSSGGDKLKSSSNSEENDKLKTYPCTQCGKVRFFILNIQC